ncbi:hypothetical protein CMI37_38495 [Candidatus Pacearchaeota archaeon]|nr:hypothetical protein [Candidatus Pacearchaeota archaeon]
MKTTKTATCKKTPFYHAIIIDGIEACRFNFNRSVHPHGVDLSGYVHWADGTKWTHGVEFSHSYYNDLVRDLKYFAMAQ